MLHIYPLSINTNLLKKIHSNAKTNVGTFYRDIVEYTTGKYDT